MPVRRTRTRVRRTQFSSTRQPRKYGGAAHRKGSDNFASKLTEKDVVRARQAHKKGASVTELADKFGVNKSTMSLALRRKTFRHVR
jgi:predicted DNA binding protein